MNNSLIILPIDNDITLLQRYNIYYLLFIIGLLSMYDVFSRWCHCWIIGVRFVHRYINVSIFITDILTFLYNISCWLVLCGYLCIEGAWCLTVADGTTWCGQCKLRYSHDKIYFVMVTVMYYFNKSI